MEKLNQYGEIEIRMSSGYESERMSMADIMEKIHKFWPKAKPEDLYFTTDHRAERGCSCHAATTEDYDSFLVINRRYLTRRILSLHTGNVLERHAGQPYKHPHVNAGGGLVKDGDFTCENETQTANYIWENMDLFQELSEKEEA